MFSVSLRTQTLEKKLPPFLRAALSNKMKIYFINVILLVITWYPFTIL